MMQYPQTLLDDIRAAIDIVDLVSRFVNLRKAGTGWKGLCPFHAEKTPSFTVNPRKGIFHCFGCGVGGDAFGFLMRQDRLSFPEAVRVMKRDTRRYAKRQWTWFGREEVDCWVSVDPKNPRAATAEVKKLVDRARIFG